MPGLETTDLYQPMLLWAKVRNNNDGQTVVSPTPVEIYTRYADGTKQVLDPQGNIIVYDQTIVTDRDIPDGSILWNGSLKDAAGFPGGIPTSGFMEAKSLDSTPDLKNRFRRRQVALMRYNDTLPVT